MPELPEVETMRRGIAGIVGSRIAGVARPRVRVKPIQIAPPLERLRRLVLGRQIVEVGRVGKRVVVRLDSGDRLVFEPRMTGRVLLSEPPNRSHLRLVFDLTGGPSPQLLFWDVRGLGVVQLLTPEQFERSLGSHRVGPDALGISGRELRERLGASRRPIKVAILDQRAVAGIGNIYASEILHRARVHPATPCNQLRTADWRRIHVQIRAVLEAAIACQGSTLCDGNYGTAQNEPGRFQDRHRVYQRAGQSCLGCGRVGIVRIVQAQRSTFFCPHCQRSRVGS